MTDKELVIYLRRSAVSHSHPFWKSADRIEALVKERDKYRDAFNTNCLVLRGTEDRAEAAEAKVRPLVDAVEALNAACDAMWNDRERLERNPDWWGQKMRIKERHVKAISEAQQRLPAILAALEELKGN